MFDTASVLWAIAFLLVVLFLLCAYLVACNWRTRRKARRKEAFLNASRDAWAANVLDGEAVSVQPQNREQAEWAIEVLLSYTDNYDDPGIRERVSRLADATLAGHLSRRLHSRSTPARQYAMLVVDQLGMASLYHEVAALKPKTKLEAELATSMSQPALPAPAQGISRRVVINPTMKSGELNG